MIKSGAPINSGKLSFLFVMFGLLVFNSFGQTQGRKKVEILHCDMLDVNQRIIANAQRLLGNINIRVDGALMWCDSLYSYPNNTVDAFGHVHIVRGDTLNMYADFIHYNGSTKLAKARRNVKLIDKKITLTTDSLDYSMVNDLAAYNYSGTVKDSTNVLKSLVGQYYVNEKKAYFKTNVEGITKDYQIRSDTLIYFTNNKKVMIEGPTRIFNEKDTLYAESGWYDSMKGLSRLTRKPLIWNAKQKLKADSIYYDKVKGEGLAMGHARIQDIENSMIVTGNRVHYNDITKIAFATDSAMLIQYTESDSLYLHADRLETMPDTSKVKTSTPISVNKAIPTVKKPKIKEETPTTESDIISVKLLPVDSVTVQKSVVDSVEVKPAKDRRLVLAYHKVRFYRKDIQGKCDSLAYFTKDSTIQFFTEPVIWAGKNQMSAAYIEMINKTKDPDLMKMNDEAFIISMENDSLRFNQIKGKNMVGYIRKNKLFRIDVKGNGQSNYYAKNDEGIIGLNKAESSNITIYMNEGRVQKIAFLQTPEGEMKPIADIEDIDKLLPGFKWLDDIRPKSRDEIFLDPVHSEKAMPASTQAEKGLPTDK
jgi:lipopolysaccharide export system protein LptA